MTAGALWAIAIAAVAAAAIVVLFINSFYKKASGDLALIRTGAGGRKVVIDGGCLVLPFMHGLQTVNLHTMRIHVVRSGNRSLITADKLRVDLEMEFFVRVLPTEQGVTRASQTIGARASFSSNDLAGLLEAKFIDSMQAAVAEVTMDDLHVSRAGFVANVSNQLHTNLEQNGLVLDSATLTSMDQTPLATLDENNAFNAVGMRILSEIISTNRKERSVIESEAELAVRQTELAAAKRKLEIEREQEQAQMSQRLELEKFKVAAESEAEAERLAKRLENERRKSETDNAIDMDKVEKSKALRQSEIEALRETENSQIASQIDLAEARQSEVAAQARLEASRAEVVRAQEALQTERQLAVAEREQRVAEIKAQEKAQIDRIGQEQEFGLLVAREQARLDAGRLSGERVAARMSTEAEGKMKVFAAENTQSDALLQHKLELQRLERLPMIAEALMKPVEKVHRINVNQVSGLGGAGGGISDASMGVANGILDLAMRLPLARQIGEQISGRDEGDEQGASGNEKAKDKPKTH